MDRITIRFSSQWKLVSMWICWWTFSPFSHVEFLLPNGDGLGAKVIGGVKIRPTEKRYRHVVDLDIEVPAGMMQEAVSMLGTKYDLLSLSSFPFRVEAQETKKTTCIEYVAELLVKWGRITLPNTHNITPYHLYLILINLRH